MMLALGFLFASALAARISYQGQQILHCHDTQGLATTLCDANIDVQGVRDGFVDVRVGQTPTEREFVESLTTCEVAVEDLEAATQEWEAIHITSRNNASLAWFDAYHTYDEIRQWFQDLQTQNPGLVTFVPSIGTTSQNRALFGIRIFDKTGGSTRQPTQRVFWTGQIHAREWIAGATVQYLVNEIIDSHTAKDTIITRFLQKTELIVLPLINPDGYVYSWTTDRQWRKNRRPAPTGGCIGVDQNRNFNDHWGQGGSSNNSCTDTYMGPSAASEPETKAISDYWKNLQLGNDRLAFVGAIDWHSYSQLVLRPYGWTSTNSPDETILKRLGDNYAADIFRSSGFNYTSQKSIQLYVTTGTASDWYYGDDAYQHQANTRVRVASYTVELRPINNPPGFLLPPAQIVPTGKENWAAIKNWLDAVSQTPIIRG